MNIIMVIISIILIPACAFLALFAFEMWREQGVSIAWPIVPAIFWIACLIILSMQLRTVSWLGSLNVISLVLGMFMLVAGVLLTIRYEMDLGDKMGIVGIVLACIAGWFLSIGFVS